MYQKYQEVSAQFYTLYDQINPVNILISLSELTLDTTVQSLLSILDSCICISIINSSISQIKVVFPPQEITESISAHYLEETGDPVEIKVLKIIKILD